jgi:small subunit ribosomal protein S16
MLSIRLARNGAKKRPFYHIVVSENDRIPTGRAIEILGFVNPISTVGENVRIDAEKAKAWIAKGAQPTDRVARLLDGLGVLTRAAQNNPKKALPKKKAQERTAAAEKAAAAAAEKAAAPAEAEA